MSPAAIPEGKPGTFPERPQDDGSGEAAVAPAEQARDGAEPESPARAGEKRDIDESVEIEIGRLQPARRRAGRYLNLPGEGAIPQATQDRERARLHNPGAGLAAAVQHDQIDLPVPIDIGGHDVDRPVARVEASLRSERAVTVAEQDRHLPPVARDVVIVV